MKYRIAALPRSARWRHIYGVALLAGIEFTMNLFVTTLSFTDPAVRGGAKLVIILGSVLSAVAGTEWLYLARRTARTTAPQG